MRTKCDRLGALAILAGAMFVLNAALAPAQVTSSTILRPEATAAVPVPIASPTIVRPAAAAPAQVTSSTTLRPEATAAVLAYDTTPTIFTPGMAEPSGEGVRFNFRGVTLDTVLDYLSKAAGFVIIRMATTDARVDVWSHQPLNNGEAIKLLDTILNEKGLTAIRKAERTLLIVRREDARTRDLPLKVGNKPDDIPKTDEMVIQVIPIRYADANQLIDNVRLILAPGATLSSNLSSNAIILIDTQSNIRRVVEIIKALDTSIAELSKLRVFPLKYADAVELARSVTDLFRARNTTTSGRGGFGGGMMGGPGGMGGRGGRGGGFNPFAAMMGGFGNQGGSGDRGGGSGDRGGSSGGMGGPGGSSGGTAEAPTVVYSTGGVSEARQAQSLVVAVADERTNSLVVSAPEDLMPMVEKLVLDIDTMSEDLTEIRVFTLFYADAEETAKMITDVFENQTQNQRGRNSNQPSRFGGGAFGRFRSPQGGGMGNQQSERKLQETTVQAVADIRTNSVVVRAAGEVMIQIEEMIKKVDLNPAKDKKVFVHSLSNADAEQVSTILESLFGSQTGQRRTTQGTSTRNQNTRSGSSSRTSNRNNQGGSSGRGGVGGGGGSSFGGGGGGGGSSFGGGGGNR